MLLSLALLWQVRAGAAPLYEVSVNLDIEALAPEAGVTMMFEKLEHSLRLDQGIGVADGLAWGLYKDTISANGWGELHVSTSGNVEMASSSAKMYAAGYVEGLLTCTRISQHYSNMRALLLKDEQSNHALSAIKQEMEFQLAFIKGKANLIDHIRSEEPTDPYWKHARFMLFQLWGLTDGYNYAAAHFKVHTLDLVDMMLLSAGSELPNLMEAFTPVAINDRLDRMNSATDAFLQKSATHHHLVRKAEPQLQDTSYAGWQKLLRRQGHCSALVKMTEGYSDIFVGHTTWDDYSKMLRIFKYYNFPLGIHTMATSIAMPSYPGALSSNDDFYALSSGLVVLDTSLPQLVLNPYDDIKFGPLTGDIPSWMHIMITNRLSKRGAEWAVKFSERNNIGTYNNQYMIVDYNLFTPGKQPPDNTLFLVETIPGKVHIQDVTYMLSEKHQGYWASDNRPFFDDIREKSGFNAAQQSSGRLYSFQDNPRSAIFKATAPGIATQFDMRGVMNRNVYPNEGFGEPNEPSMAISARNDLSTSPIPNGGIDAKVVSRCLLKAMNVQAISGPTHDSQKVFRWTDDTGRSTFPGWPHAGQPDVWNFGWTEFTPTGQIAPFDTSAC